VVTLDEAAVSAAQVGHSDRDLYSEVTIELSTRSPGPLETLWTPDDAIVVHPGETLTSWAQLDAAAVEYASVEWRAMTAGGRDVTAAVTLTPTYYAQRVRLVWHNAGSQAAYIRAMKIIGRVLVGGRSLDVKRAAPDGDTFWHGTPLRQPRTRTVRSNVYIQSEAQAGSLAAFLLDRCKRPVMVATASGVDRPDVRIGRRCTLTYPNMVGGAEAITGVVIGVTWTANSNGFKQDLTLLETGAMFDPAGGYFVLGSPASGVLGAAGVGTAILFY
jgi:hypothetical protein